MATVTGTIKLNNNTKGHERALRALGYEVEADSEKLTVIGTPFGGFENFKTALSDAAMKRFGSGWAWLSLDPKGKLVIESTANQDSPIMHGNKPLFGIDVWEHAYYLLYQNRRADYVGAIFNVVDWDAVGKRFAAARG